jgi:hypothetical protein
MFLTMFNNQEEHTMKECYAKLNPLALGLSMGVVYALSLFLVAMVATHWDYGYELIELMENFYPGYGVGLVPSLIGAAWGLLEGTVFGFLMAVFYNIFHKCCCCMCSCMKKHCENKKCKAGKK